MLKQTKQLKSSGSEIFPYCVLENRKLKNLKLVADLQTQNE